MSSIEPSYSGCEVDGRQEISGGFVVARGDGSELFEFTEEIFDEVSRFIEISVKIGGRQTIWPRWDYGRFAGGCEGLADPRVSIESLVGDQRISGHLRQQRVGSDQIMGLSRRQQERQRVAECVDQGVDFCAQPAAAFADCLVLIFFWERRRGAGAPARSCCRAWRIRCRPRWRGAQTPVPTPRPSPSG